MCQRGFRRALEFRDDALGQDFAKLDAPLVERIDLPDGALGEDGMFVKSDEFAESLRREPGGEDRVRRAVAFEHAMRDEPVWRALGFDLLRRFAECQRFGLGEDVCQEHVVVAAERIERLHKGDEVTRDEPRSLMDELVEGVLAVGARLAPIDRARGVGDICSIDGDVLSIALHRQLLEVRGKSLQVLLVRQHRNRLGAEEIAVPDAQEADEDRQVALKRRGAEMFIHLMEAVQHGAEILRTDGQHGRKTDRRIHRVASADPIPEAEHVGGVDAELCYFRGVRRNRDEVLGDRFLVAAQTRQRPGASGVRVGHRLERRERFRGDNEERLGRIEIADGFGEVGAIDIGNEAETSWRDRCNASALRRP